MIISSGWLRLVGLFSRSTLGRDRRAVTAIEYAIIGGIIVIAVVGSAIKIAPHLNSDFNNVSSEL